MNHHLLTFAVSVDISEDRAFLDVAEGSQKFSDILLSLLFAQHSYEQLSVLWNVAFLYFQNNSWCYCDFVIVDIAVVVVVVVRDEVVVIGFTFFIINKCCNGNYSKGHNITVSLVNKEILRS